MPSPSPELSISSSETHDSESILIYEKTSSLSVLFPTIDTVFPFLSILSTSKIKTFPFSISYESAEAFEGHANTAGAVVYYGNLSVNASSSDSDMKQYYWEIYELMGDPSLMPWLGKAADLSVTLVRGTNNLRVVTSPNAYVAIVDEADFNLRGAAFADASGVVTFDIPASTDLSGARLSVTLQNHKPFSQPCSMVSIDESNALTNLQVYPNPATDRVTIDGLPEGSTVEVYDAQGRKVEYVKCGNSGTLTQLHINTLPAGLYLLRIQTPSTVIVRKIIVNK